MIQFPLQHRFQIGEAELNNFRIDHGVTDGPLGMDDIGITSQRVAVRAGAEGAGGGGLTFGRSFFAVPKCGRVNCLNTLGWDADDF